MHCCIGMCACSSHQYLYKDMLLLTKREGGREEIHDVQCPMVFILSLSFSPSPFLSLHSLNGMLKGWHTQTSHISIYNVILNHLTIQM